MDSWATGNSEPAEPNVLAAPALRASWVAWPLFLLAVCIVLFWTETGKPVNNAYACGAECWIDRQDLYHGGIGFIYLPQSAVLYAPFHLLPGPVEQVLWRAITIGLFAAGVFRLTRLARPDPWFEFFPLVTLMILPKTWTSAYSGQATPAMAGLLMMALGAVHEKNWNRCAALLLAALAFKPLAIVLLLLLGAIYRPLSWRLAVGVGIFLAVPYLTQDWRYVNNQYAAALTMFDDAMKIGLTPDWAQVFSLGSLVGIEISEQWQTVVRIVLAGGTLALCWFVRRNEGDAFVPTPCGTLGANSADLDSRSEILPLTQRPALPTTSRAAPELHFIYALSVCYLLLLNPRTENNSYVMLTPVLAVSFMQAAFVERRMVRAGLLCAGAVALLAGHAVCDILTPHAGFVWICPLVCLLFALDCVLGVLPLPARPAMVCADGIEPPVSVPFPRPVRAGIGRIADAA